MFIHTNQLNEGSGFQKTEDIRKRELNEGNNPRIATNDWTCAENHALSNSSWQKLRK